MAEIYQPTLVIGLGGTGKKIIVALKKMIAENTEHGMADFPFLKVLSLDTDQAAPVTKSAIKTIRDEALSINDNKEKYQLQCGFGTVPDFKDYPEIGEWFPDSLKSLLMPAELAKGAGQKKPVGRFTFAWNASEIYEELNSFLRAPVDATIAKDKNIAQKLSKTINVFICGSICGGTGSGTFLDTAYLVRYISKINQGNGYQTKIFGMFALASLFDSIQGAANIRQNCYASLVELDHFMNPVNFENPNRTFYPAYKNYKPDYTDSSKNRPFDYPFLFDNFGKGLALNSQDAFTEMAARFIYLLTGHELSNHWFSMDSNVGATLEQTYNKEILNKSINYRSMGTFSILYPKRMIVQLCAYNLSKEYMTKILADDYNPQEVDALARKFLTEKKLNPLTDQLERQFDKFMEGGITYSSFTEYVEQMIADKMESEVSKSEVEKDLYDWKVDMDGKIQQFRNLNSDISSKIRESFLANLDVKLTEILDLHSHPSEIKKDSNGNPLQERGSLIRAQKFIEALIKIFEEAKEKYRRQLNEAEAIVNQVTGDYAAAMTELSEKAEGFTASKKKIEEAKENVLNICRDLYSAKRKSFVADWIVQLFTDILWNEVPKYPGILKELEEYRAKYLKATVTFKDMSAEIDKFLDNNKRFEPNPFFDVIYDYNIDVLGAYKTLVEEKGEDYIFGELSNELTAEDKFGPTYMKAAAKTGSLINLDLLSASEKFFFEPVKKINISERLLETKDICDRLESGQYYQMANIYLGLEQSVLDRVNLNFSNSSFFAISIPDEYQGKPCANIKGVVKANGNNQICPMEQDPEKFSSEPCPLFNRCLKQKLLRNAPGNVAITPTSEISEINLMHTIAGYPLSAVSSVMNNCKPVYEEQKAKQQRENESLERDSEAVNMFGPMDFDALDAATVDPRSKSIKAQIKKAVFVGLITKRLVIKPLSVDFVTEKDIMLERRDKPSLNFGANLEEFFKKQESTRIKDKLMIDQFITEMNNLIEKGIKADPNAKQKFVEMAQQCYEEYKGDLPRGLTTADLDYMIEVVQELGDITLKSEATLKSYF